LHKKNKKSQLIEKNSKNKIKNFKKNHVIVFRRVQTSSFRRSFNEIPFGRPKNKNFNETYFQTKIFVVEA
jgi:hypothetical protein